MRKSDLIRIIREEVSTVLMELSDDEKKANIASAQAEVKAKEIALKKAQEKLKQVQSAAVDQK